MRLFLRLFAHFVMIIVFSFFLFPPFVYILIIEFNIVALVLKFCTSDFSYIGALALNMRLGEPT